MAAGKPARHRALNGSEARTERPTQPAASRIGPRRAGAVSRGTTKTALSNMPGGPSCTWS
eukprot:scaffold38147_cov69-Phaeocystis_antarctica.AAC.2